MPENPIEVLPQIHIPGVSDPRPASQRIRVHHVFILDKSYSMSALQQQTIIGFNEQVQNIRQLEAAHPEQEQLVTLVLFNGRADTCFFDVPSAALREITTEDYQPSGSTNLYGTVGLVVNDLKTRLGDRCASERVIITIMTDGENTTVSFPWTREATARLLAQVQRDYNWVVTFIGANVDVDEAARDLAIPLSNTVSYTSNQSSTARVFAEANVRRTAYLATAAEAPSNIGYFASADERSRGLDLREPDDHPPRSLV